MAVLPVRGSEESAAIVGQGPALDLGVAVQLHRGAAAIGCDRAARVVDRDAVDIQDAAVGGFDQTVIGDGCALEWSASLITPLPLELALMVA